MAPLRPRSPNGSAKVYKGADGYFHGRVLMGVKEDGSEDRRHVMYRNEADAIREVQRLEKERDAGLIAKAGRVPTVAEWMRTWLDTIAPRTAQQTTVDEIYRPKVERWIIPRLGKHRLDRLLPEHVDSFYTYLGQQGLSTKTVRLIHQILSRALKMAVRRGKVARNVASPMYVETPTHREQEIEPLNQAEARKILDLAAVLPNGARWSVALALGLRQGEALGMRWGCIDLKAGTLRVFQIKRTRYRHGCEDPHACGETRHREACATPCEKHKKRCPVPCRPDCRFHAERCPQRLGGEWEFRQPKGGKVRTVVLPEPLIRELKAHWRKQKKLREAAGEEWEDWDLCFPNSLGKPYESRDDWADWKWLCKAAGVRDARLHDARHTAATLLLEQGVDIRVVQEILGHSTLAVTKRYTHVTSRLAKEAAERMSRALWELPDDDEASDSEK
ncbi:site-specific integrase [Actinospica sp. MGRD01-02]|uniref:Site-specific integrase n=1 Tax=Actinospica acidithermotolerans TaxID=2828514 RepID=A0A941ECH9_9ACTN|nr:tyrosine-type recombinase/integrase [Actinospica acidithermotolerans]MBR7830240.1 site-specific integrase [Actinospica acidithermotolerans]